MDDADHAQVLIDAHLERSLARQRAAARAGGAVLFCRRCGEEIPEARRRAVASPDCIDCARDAEAARGRAA